MVYWFRGAPPRGAKLESNMATEKVSKTTKQAKPATPLPKLGFSVTRSEIVSADWRGKPLTEALSNDEKREIVRRAEAYPRLEAERAELVAALRGVMEKFVGDRGAHNLLGADAGGKEADAARALLARLGAE